MKIFPTPIFALLLSVSALSSLIAEEGSSGDEPQKKELVSAFLSFYMSVGPARAATDPAEVVKAGGDFWHLPDDKSRQSLLDFSAWLLAAKPTDIAVGNVKTAGDLARITIQFSDVKEPYPSRAEVTLVRLGLANDRSWKIVSFGLADKAPATAPVSSNAPVLTVGDGAGETLESYLTMLSKEAANPVARSTAPNPQKLSGDLAEWWVQNPERSQTREMTQSAMFFRLYEPKEWDIKLVGSASATAANFSVTVQPGNEISRRLGPKILKFGLVLSEKTAGWKISSFTNPQLVPVK